MVVAQGLRRKVAEIGGDGQDASFERSMANMAHGYLQDAAPGLLDHELGFQLVDRTDDNKKALGLTVFQLPGGRRAMSPLFFLKGQARGHELFFLQDENAFVPLKQNWVDYVLNRRARVMGSGHDRQTSRLGVRQPLLTRLAQPPSKYACALSDDDLQPLRVKMAELVVGGLGKAMEAFRKHVREELNLEVMLKQAAAPAVDAVLDLMRRKPAVAAAYDRWYGLDTLNAARKEARLRERGEDLLHHRPPMITGCLMEKLAEPTNDVEILAWDASRTDPAPADLDEKEAEKLLRETVLIRDRRSDKDVSTAYQLAVSQRLSNPSETGIYEVLSKEGDFIKALVVVNPQGANGRERGCVVVDMSGDAPYRWGTYRIDQVWVSSMPGSDDRIPGGLEDWRESFDELSESESLAVGKRYLLLSSRRHGTTVFQVLKKHGDGVYEIWCEELPCPESLMGIPAAIVHPTRADEYSRYTHGCRLHLDTRQGTQLRSSMGELYAPGDFRVVRLAAAKGDDEDMEYRTPRSPGLANNTSEEPPLQPGQPIDAEMDIRRKTAELRVRRVGEAVRVGDWAPLPAPRAVAGLVQRYGLREKAARAVVDDAIAAKGEWREWRVKLAGPYDQAPYMMDQGPTAPYFPEPPMTGGNFMGWDGPTTSPYAENVPIPEMSASMTDPNIYNVRPDNAPPPLYGDGQLADTSAQQGDREIFDTSMISGLLRAVRDDTLVDRYLPALVKALDHLGRLLFIFYWRQDRLADRYGQSELPELEDNLRNAFEQLGDVVLWLKQKTVRPDTLESAQSNDLL